MIIHITVYHLGQLRNNFLIGVNNHEEASSWLTKNGFEHNPARMTTGPEEEIWTREKPGKFTFEITGSKNRSKIYTTETTVALITKTVSPSEVTCSNYDHK